MLGLHVQRATWIVGAIFAALLFFLGGFAVRLLMGPISLGPFAGAIEDSINRSVSGLVVRFDKAVLEWSRADGKINLIVLGTKVFDLDGRIIAQAPKADLDFDAAFLIGGPLSVKRFSLIGVQLTGVRSKEGAIHLGFNGEQGAPDILETIHNILRNSAQGSGSLQSFAIRDARMAFSDEASGMFVVSPDTTFTLEDSAGRLHASFDSAVEISGVPARIAFRATLRDNGIPEQGSLEVHGLSVSALAENSASLAALRPYRLISDLGGSFVLSETGDLASAAFHVSGAGTVNSAALQMPLALDHFNVQGRYTAEGNRLTLDAIDIGGKQISAKAKASIALAWNGTSLSTVSGDISAEQLKITLPNWTNGPIALSRASFKGAYDAAAHKLSWERGSVRDGPLVADLSGSLVFAQGGSPALKLSGSIEDIPIRDLLRYWPASVAQGAYLWIDESIPDGRIGPVKITANLPVGALDAETLPDEVLSLSFPFTGTTIRYLNDLTPLTGARGQALLTGSAFHATAVQGNVGPLAVKNGDVLLRDIHALGAPGRVRLRSEGKLQDTLLLIDQAPLGYPSRFGVDPASTSGQAVVDLDFVIPLRRDVAMEEIGIGVQAKLVDASLPLDQRFKLERGTVSLDIDANSLIAQGSGLVSGVPATFSWSESFASLGNSTRIDVAAVLDDKSRPLLGLTQPDWVKGVLPFTASLWGRRFHFTDAAVKANTTNATAEYKLVNLQKRSGVPGNVSAFLHFADDGAISISDLAVDGEGLQVRGGLELDSNGTLTKAALSRILAEPSNDFALNLGTMASGGLDVRVEGKSLDARRLFGEAMSGSEKKTTAAEPASARTSSDLNEPLSLSLKLDTLSLRDNFSVRDVALDVSFAPNEHLDSFSLDAVGPMNGKISGRLLDVNGARTVTLDVDDAGSFIKGIVGFPSIQGGSLEARLSLPNAIPARNGSEAKPKPRPYAGAVTLSNIVVTDQPFMARLLAAGSLDGPQRLLKGGGIPVAHFNAPFAAHDKIVSIRDGRFSGTALGATFEGTLDRETDRVDIAGTLVPIYGLNSVLGSVPLLGDLFVSKQGEGIFGLTYAMRGDLNEPTLSVNPLSVLTPGIFRRIFEFSTPKDAPQASVGTAAKAE